MPVSLYYQVKYSFFGLGGLNTKKNDSVPVIVSLTSIPSRFKKLHLGIKSILDQSVLPEKIVLWLNESQRGKIPKSLEKLKGSIFEIRYSQLDCSHLKLVESLKHFPNKIIVTADDDLIYRKKWLECLYLEHQRHPECIIANQSRIISYDRHGQLKPYREWPTNYNHHVNSMLLLPIGSAGALYPPNSLSSTTLDWELFLKLAPKADDLWFKAMSLLKHTKSIQSSLFPGHPIPIWGSQEINLKKWNIQEDKNRTQWLALTKHFKFDLKID